MELINNNINNVFLLLAFSSVFFSAIAICVPLNINITDVESTAIPPLLEQTVSPQVAPDQSPPAVTTVSQPPEATSPQTSTSDQSSSNEISDEENSGLLGLDYLHSDGLISTAASTVKTNLVEICDVTSNPQLCKTSISSHIEGTKVDPASALKTEIEESIKEVTKAIATLNSLRKDSSASETEIACYDTCLENFDMAIEDLKAGVESIDARDAGRMESVLTAVLTDLTTCDDTFAEMGVDSPLDNLSTKMSKYASNCLAISKLLL
ncbi:pectinesterase inhibitor 1 [Cucumis melo var. makuwa]|uniref:Pectinesterase inhibitor 1 n=2 Tax=Cucumis melo TaxID=3656 RepID=A0A5A7TT72_CUCMM|nr:pectinesterase inhibitor 1 [Cucumis melo var. makuwa]TYK29546.1 pectinesterase inhibitor 1 [Cucumis melo var. makuwa]